jgi:hypothetical protein
MRHSLKIMVLAALALVAVFAVNASAAQAFKLFKNGGEVSSLSLTGKSSESGALLVPDLALTILCAEAHGTATATASGGTVTATATVTFLNCTVENNKNCKVTIEPAKGKGKLEMSGSEDFIIAEPEVKIFTTIFLEGELCTLPEEEPISGTARIGLPNPEAELASHEVTIDESALKYGTHTALIDGSGTNTLVHGTIENAGAKFSAKL